MSKCGGRFGWLGAVLVALLMGLAPAARADMNPFAEYANNIARLAQQNDAAHIRAQLSQGASPNQVDETNKTGLMIAAANGNLQIVAILYKASADINQRDRIGSTALHYAAEHDRLEVVKLLLEMGAKVDVENNNGTTPLMFAARAGDVEMVRALLAKGANPSKSDYTGRDPLGYAMDGHRPMVIQTIKDAIAHKH